MNIPKIITAIKRHRRYILLGIIDIVFFGLFSPGASAFVIIPAFVLVVLTVFVVLRLVAAYIGKIMAIKPTYQRRIVIILTASIGVIIALQSIGQLTIRDTVTITPLIIVSYVYVSYSKSRRAE